VSRSGSLYEGPPGTRSGVPPGAVRGVWEHRFVPRTQPTRQGAVLPAGYPEFLAEVKARIAAARTRAVLAVNSELIRLYWEIGRGILEREEREGWGAKVIDRLAADLRRELPEMTGLSRSNLHYMRSFAKAWPSAGGADEIVPRPVGQLPWGHIRCLLDKLDSSESRLWYADQAVENGWSRSVLEAQIATNLKGRLGSALTSFDHALPAPDSELVRDAIKDPYNFEFLTLSQEARERELESALWLERVEPGYATGGRIGEFDPPRDLWISREEIAHLYVVHPTAGDAEAEERTAEPVGADRTML